MKVVVLREVLIGQEGVGGVGARRGRRKGWL